MTPEALEELILAPADPWDLQRAFAGLDEKARAKLWPAALRLRRQLYSRKANDDASDRLKQLLAQRAGAPWGSSIAPEYRAPENRNATLALCALGRFSAVKSHAIYVSDVQPVLERILEDRRPDWIDDWIAHELKRGFTRLDFPTIRAWVKAGICRKPMADGYYHKFAWHLMRTPYPRDTGQPVPPISQQLLEDPDLLEDVPGIFKVETGIVGAEAWSGALAKLSAEGRLDRAELLRLALDGLRPKMKEYHLSGLHDFYVQMAPTPQEMLQHQPDFMALLCHPVSLVAKFAIDMLAKMEKQGALDSQLVLREIQNVFAGKSKGNAIAALNLIKRMAARSKGGVSPALSAAAEALRHSNTDVQVKALELLEANARRLERSELDLIAGLENFVSASNRGRLRALVGEPAGAEPARARVEQVPVAGAASEAYSPISGDITVQRVLCADAELTPIASIDALIDAALHAVEVVDSPDEIELIVDAISRLADQPPADFDQRVAPLLHRLQHGRTGYKGLGASNAGVGLAVIDLIVSWARGQMLRTPSASSIRRDEDDAFVPMIAHLRDVAERAARKEGRPLLCVPTHKSGWIDPVAWVGRLRELADVANLGHTMDFRLSLLRLAPDRRAEALQQAGSLPASVRRIAIFALGGEAVPDKTDRHAYAVWISAARCRAPLADWSTTFQSLGLEDACPDGLRPAEYSWYPVHKAELRQNPRLKLSVLRSAVSCLPGEAKQDAPGAVLAGPLTSGLDRLATDWSELPTAALCRQAEPKSYYYGGDLTASWVVKWLAYAWPQNPAAAQMKGASMLARKMDDESIILAPWFGFLQSLFQKNRPWGEAGHLLLCLGLVGKDADVKGLAVDALIEGIEGRVFDPRAFVDVMTRLCEGQWAKLSRLTDGLLQVAQVSALHARVVSEALQAWLPLVDFKDRRALHVLEVLVETQAITQQPLAEPAQAALRGIRGSGKTAKLAKDLLRAG